MIKFFFLIKIVPFVFMMPAEDEVHVMDPDAFKF